ncbi:hypothetical protein KKF84_14800 [Myxococcota bacterium]|nr:hypothetical protein [Myxococcota bacterium]MBU1536592.1 hypothetical protein [Myxococcota bacterium]
MQRNAIVFSCLLVLGSCGKKSDTTPNNKDDTATASRPRLPKPLSTSSRAMFKLRELIAEGRKMGSNYNGKKLFAHSGLTFDDRCLAKGSVQVHELKAKGGALLGAVFQVRPNAFTPCEKETENSDDFIPPSLCTVTLVGTSKLRGQTFMPLCAGNKKLDITIEPGKWGISLVSIEYEESGDDNNCKKEEVEVEHPGETSTNVLYFSLKGGTLTELLNIILGMHSNTPGELNHEKGSGMWYWLIINAVKTPVLVVTTFESMRPDAGSEIKGGADDEGGGENPITCSTSVTFYKLNPEGTKMTEVSKKEDIAALRKHKTLGEIPLTQEAEGDAACEKLRP